MKNLETLRIRLHLKQILILIGLEGFLGSKVPEVEKEGGLVRRLVQGEMRTKGRMLVKIEFRGIFYRLLNQQHKISRR